VPDTAGMLYLTRREVVRAVEKLDPVGIVRDALALHAAGRTTLPDEAYLPWETSRGSFARSLALPGALWGETPVLGVKLINSSLDNHLHGLPRANGVTLLFDRETARPKAIMDAAHLSALRTAAYTVLSVRLLAAPDVRRIGVVGCGALGAMHVRLLAEILPSARFHLFDVHTGQSTALADAVRGQGVDCAPVDSAEAAVRDQQVVVTTTTTTTGYLRYDWLSPGALIAHVSLDDVLPEVVALADLVVIDDWPLVSADDRRILGRMYRSGELLGPDGEAFARPRSDARRVDATLADVVAGSHVGRTSDEQIVLSNPFGMGILDVAVAGEVLRVAGELGLGTFLPHDDGDQT
jgi:ornithine cyclodeaminase/alanine dehydrogenase-like protein (mu-crystallin family)